MVDTVSVTEAAEFIPTIVSQESLLAVKGSIVVPMLINRNLETDKRFSIGDTCNVPIPGTFSVNSKAAQTAVTLQNPTATKVSVTLDQHSEVTFIIEDIVTALAGDTLPQHAYNAGVAHAESLETYLCGLFNTFSGSTLGTAGTAVTLPLLTQIRQALFDAKVPKADLDGLSFVCSSGDGAALLQIERFTSAEKVGGNKAIINGALRRYFGLDVFESQFIEVTAGSPNQNENMAFHRDAMMLVTRMLADVPPGFGTRSNFVQSDGVGFRQLFSYDNGVLGFKFTQDILYGAAKLRDAFGQRVLS